MGKIHHGELDYYNHWKISSRLDSFAMDLIRNQLSETANYVIVQNNQFPSSHEMKEKPI